MTNGVSSMFSWNWRLADIKQTKPIKVFSMFSCGGGSSMGYKRAGFDVIGNCEIDAKVNAVYVKNLHPRFNFNMDAREFVAKDDLPSELLSLDILDGSPPCTTFSVAGTREKSWGVEKRFAEGRQKQRLDDLFFVYLNAVERLKPKVCIAENVEGLLKGNARGYVSEILTRLTEIGYATQLFLLQAEYMNVPQRRHRVFFIANRMQYPSLSLAFNEMPIPFGECKSFEGKNFRNQDCLHAKVLRRLAGKPKNISEARKDGLHGSYMSPILYDDEVPPTLCASVRPYRADLAKYLSDSDIRNISTFPQDYDFCGMRAEYICGMSVPPNMMANVAAQLWEQWFSRNN